MTTMRNQNKRKDVLKEIQHVVKRKSVEAYTKAMEKRLTTKGHTEQVLWLTYQLGWLVNERIVHVNLNVVDLFK